MLYRYKSLLLIFAIILIPIMLGMTPLNFMQKMANGCPYILGQQMMKCHACPFNSIVSQNDIPALSLASTPSIEEPSSAFYSPMMEPISISSNTLLQSVPLRC